MQQQLTRKMLGEAIKDLIKKQKFTEGAFAHMIGVSPPTLYNWLNGKFEPGVMRFRLMCQILDANPTQLLGMSSTDCESCELVRGVKQLQPAADRCKRKRVKSRLGKKKSLV